MHLLSSQRKLKKCTILNMVCNKESLILLHRLRQFLKIGLSELSGQVVCPAIRMHRILHHSLLEFYAYIQRLNDAGFENRIMFGSDEMVWPDALSVAIDTVASDPALNPEQKRDIFYNNAARFPRLK